MPSQLKPLSKAEIKDVTQRLQVLAQYLNKVIPFLQQEARITPQKIAQYEQEYGKMVKVLSRLRKEMKEQLGWFSPFEQLLSHTQSRLKQCRKLQ